MLAEFDAVGQGLRAIDRAVSRGIQPDDAWIGWLLYALAALIVVQTVRLIVRKQFSSGD